MRIVITGGCGFLGRRLALLLLDKGSALGAIEELVLFDNAPSALPLPDDRRVRVVTGDIADRDTAQRADPAGHRRRLPPRGDRQRPGRGRHRSRLPGQSRRHRAVLDACRALGTAPRLVFASSLAAYGGALPPEVGDDTPLNPQTSYGTQKAIGELLVNDYSRKGFIDGRALRLPTVVVRPGLPNRAASTFARRSSASRYPARTRFARSFPRR